MNCVWSAFKGSMEKMGKRIEEAKDEYVRLVSTRSNQLARPLIKIDNLRKQRGILEAPADDGIFMLEEPEETVSSPATEKSK